MAFPASLGLDFGSSASGASAVDTAPISNEAFTGAFAVGSGATARTESQFSPDQQTERMSPSPFSSGGFPMEILYVGGALIFGAIILKKVLK